MYGDNSRTADIFQLRPHELSLFLVQMAFTLVADYLSIKLMNQLAISGSFNYFVSDGLLCPQQPTLPRLSENAAVLTTISTESFDAF